MESTPKPPTYSDLKPRIIGAAVLGALAIIFLWWGGFVFAGFVAIGLFLMSQELLHMVRRDWNVPNTLGYLAGFSLGATALCAGLPFWAPVAFLILALVIGGFGARKPPNLVAILGFSALAFAGVGAVLLRLQPGGLWLISWIILCVIAADVGGYAFGRKFQGPKFWPAVSPKKTWSGVLGGLGLTLGVALIFCVSSGGNLGAFLIFGGLIAVVSVMGDLLESAVKRHYGVKDAGSLLPGHGGLLDRFDGMTAVMILFLIFVQLTDLQGMLGVSYTPIINGTVL